MFPCIFSLVILNRISGRFSNFFLNNGHTINAMVLLSNKLFIIIGNSSFSSLISEKIINHKFCFSKFHLNFSLHFSSLDRALLNTNYK